MTDSKERVAILQLDDDNALLSVLSKLTKEETDKLKHLLWVVEMERDEKTTKQLKAQKSYFDEFKGVYLNDGLGNAIEEFTEYGDILLHIKQEVDYLVGREDHGSMERLFFLRKWVYKKFSVEV